MKKFDVIYLVIETPSAHGVFDTNTHTEYMRYCEVQSVGMNETYQMKDHHLQAEWTFILSCEDEYIDTCKIVKYNNKKYNITRTYLDGTGKFRLICSSQLNGGG